MLGRAGKVRIVNQKPNLDGDAGRDRCRDRACKKQFLNPRQAIAPPQLRRSQI
jgi:hypothetical protein